MKYSILMFISICLIAYLLGCFIETSFNLTEWEKLTRGMIGSCGVLFGLMGGGITLEIQNR